MSYRKAMKHARNVHKCRKQARMHFGFDSSAGPTPAARANPLLSALIDVREWFRDRHHEHPLGAAYVRECIRERIADLRALRAGQPE